MLINSSSNYWCLISVLYFLLLKGVYEEAKYFGIYELLPQLESIIEDCNKLPDESPLSRRDVINATVMTDSNRYNMTWEDNRISYSLNYISSFKWCNFLIFLHHFHFISKYSELRFQGVNLAGADLSKLDLRRINFK